VKTDWHCIEFAKTVGWRPRDRDDDELETFEGLVSWCRTRGILTPEEADEVSAQAARRPADADRALRDAHNARALVYRILSRIARSEALERGYLEELNGLLHHMLPTRRLTLVGKRVEWTWTVDAYRLDRLIAPVVLTTAELLTSPEVVRLRLCEADDCGWLFIDGSRNRSRRWCDMSDCGNRAKVKRFRERRRSEK
jgi:predicted RNA-binding Zn ribbon-like protein